MDIQAALAVLSNQSLTHQLLMNLLQVLKTITLAGKEGSL
jgi:hypothetical protein